MAKIENFEDIVAWQKARVVAKKLFDLYQIEPFSRDYELKNQINGSSGSVMDNIAEGFERGSRKEFIQFLAYSKGSAGELRSQLYRAKDRNYINESIFQELFAEIKSISKMISGLTEYLKKSEYKGTRFNEDQAPYNKGDFNIEL